MQQHPSLLPTLFRRAAGFLHTTLALALLVGLLGAATAFMPGPAATTEYPTGALADTTIVKLCAGEFYVFGPDTLTVSGFYSDTLIAQDGTDSIVSVDLAVFPVVFTSLEAGICDSSFYVFGGDTLQASGIYTDTLTTANGCDSLVTLNLRVESFFDDTLNVTVCPGDSYVFGGDTLTLAGTYTDSLTAAGGCDSIVTLVLDIPLPVGTTLDEQICANESYLFAGDTLALSGIYTDTLTATNGCDSVITLKLNVLPLDQTALNAAICANETYLFNGQLLTNAGVYSATFAGDNGCDSLVTLTLDVLPLALTLLEIGICDSSFYVFGGDTLDQTGVYRDTLSAENGCDSIVTLRLQVQSFFQDTFQVTICPDASYVFGGDTLTLAGTYTDSLTAAGGCDSIVTLVLDVALPVTTTIEATICANEGYLFGGDTLDQPGTYLDTLTTAIGCDSTITLKLDVLPVADTAISDVICANGSYDFNGQILTLAGVYTDTLTAENGCDSLVTLTLEVLPTADSTLFVTICAFETYEFNGPILDESGTYTAILIAENGCDSIVTLQLTVLPEQTLVLDATICTGESYAFAGLMLTMSGVYSTIVPGTNDCDSVILLNLVVLPTTSNAFTVTICSNDGYVFGGDTLQLPGTYVDTLTAANGCDSVATLTLQVLPTADSALAATICANETFAFNGQLLNQAGIYTDTLNAANGCDSLLTLTLNVLPLAGSTQNTSLCAGDTLVFNGQAYTQTGIYRDTFTAANGCDSIATLVLTVQPLQDTLLAGQICQGASYLFNSQLLTESGSYTAIYPDVNGCDSTVTLQLDVLPALTSSLEATICAGETFPFNGLVLDQSGTYIAAYVANGGCDSLVTLTLTMLPAQNTALTAAICPGASYTFDGQTLDTAGTYTAVYTDVNGCDSTVTLQLSILPTTSGNQAVTICSNETFNFNGQILNQAGSYTATLTGVNGCDSTATLLLSVLYTVTGSVSATICSNEPYNFNGQVLNQAGNYTATLTAANGCDSVVTLTLSVLAVPTTALAASICAGETYLYNGTTYTQGGTYDFTFTAANGCDSLVTLNLTVLPVPTATLSFAICQGTNFLYQGDTLTATGSYSYVLTAANGCDSLVTLDLTVTPSPSTQLVYTICEGTGLVYQGDTLEQSGSYTYFFVGSTGCDSTVVLTLSILPEVTTTANVSICEGETYLFNNQELNAAGTYTAVFTGPNSCDSTVVLNLSVLPNSSATMSASICEGETYPFGGLNLTQAGLYTVTLQNANGCDSVLTLALSVTSVQYSLILVDFEVSVQAANATFQWIDCATNLPIAGETGSTFAPAVSGSYAVLITQNGCTVQSTCVNIIVVGTDAPGFQYAWTLQPNPARDAATLQLSAPAEQELTVTVFDLNGRLLQKQVLPQGASLCPLDLSALPQGVLLVRLTDGARSATKRLVKTNE